MSREEFIEKIGKLASEDMTRSGILASLTVAQAIRESEYGTSELAVKANALFGIKVNGWTGNVYDKKTKEFVNGKYIEVIATFRAYNSWEESVRDHSDYLTSREKAPGVLRYGDLIGETDYKEACRKIKADGYATDPDYPKALISIIERYNLTRFDEGGKHMSKKVFIGVGHGGSDPGAVKYLRESDVNLTMATACKEYLEANGVIVKMSRTKDENDSISEEVKECNAFNPDLAVDIHNNAGGGDGFEVLVSISGGVGRTLGANIEEEVKKIGQNSRGIKTRKNSAGKDYFAFIRSIKCPSVICEGVFVDNANDVKIADTIEEQRKFGVAYAKGILKTLKITPGSTVTPTTTPATNESNTSGSFKVRVSISNLWIRKGAGTNYGKIKFIKPGLYTIVEVKSGQGSKKGWGRLKSGAGWISLDYAKRV